MASSLPTLIDELSLLEAAFSEEQALLSNLIDELDSLHSEINDLLELKSEINAVKVDRDARIENFSLKSDLMLADLHKAQEELEDCLIVSNQQSQLLRQNSEQKRRLSILVSKLLKKEGNE